MEFLATKFRVWCSSFPSSHLHSTAFIPPSLNPCSLALSSSQTVSSEHWTVLAIAQYELASVINNMYHIYLSSFLPSFPKFPPSPYSHASPILFLAFVPPVPIQRSFRKDYPRKCLIIHDAVSYSIFCKIVVNFFSCKRFYPHSHKINELRSLRRTTRLFQSGMLKYRNGQSNPAIPILNKPKSPTGLQSVPVFDAPLWVETIVNILCWTLLSGKLWQ